MVLSHSTKSFVFLQSINKPWINEVNKLHHANHSGFYYILRADSCPGVGRFEAVEFKPCEFSKQKPWTDHLVLLFRWKSYLYKQCILTSFFVFAGYTPSPTFGSMKGSSTLVDEIPSLLDLFWSSWKLPASGSFVSWFSVPTQHLSNKSGGWLSLLNMGVFHGSVEERVQV